MTASAVTLAHCQRKIARKVESFKSLFLLGFISFYKTDILLYPVNQLLHGLDSRRRPLPTGCL